MVQSTFCGASTSTLVASGGTNGFYRWYSPLSGGGLQLIPGANSNSINVGHLPYDSVKTYYVSIFTAAGCESPLVRVDARNFRGVSGVGSYPMKHMKTYINMNHNFADLSGNGHDGTKVGGVTDTVDVNNNSLHAYYFNGIDGQIQTAKIATAPPVRGWSAGISFKAVTGGSGKLFGWSSTQDGTGQYSRHLYMDDGGLLHFGIYAGGAIVANSTRSYRDNKWHTAVVTVDSGNSATIWKISLYVDGNRVGNTTATAAPESPQGYFHISGGALGGGWPNHPTSPFWKGYLDEFFYADTVLVPSSLKGAAVGVPVKASQPRYFCGITPDSFATITIPNAEVGVKYYLLNFGQTIDSGSVVPGSIRDTITWPLFNRLTQPLALQIKGVNQSNGCSSILDSLYLYSVTPAVSSFSYLWQSQKLIANGVNAGDSAQYYWYRDTNLDTVTTVNYRILSAFGCYTVRSQVFGCLSEESAPFCYTGTNPLLAKEDVKLYPNPATGKVSISVPTSFTGSSRISITDGLGRTLRSVTSNQLSNEFDLTDLSAGMYMVRVQNGASVQVKQLVINK